MSEEDLSIVVAGANPDKITKERVLNAELDELRDYRVATFRGFRNVGFHGRIQRMRKQTGRSPISPSAQVA